MNNLYIALLHYPVYNKKGTVVTTAVANMDIHDIARTARTYGVKGFYLVTPIEAQQRLVEKILCHWRTGYGSLYNPSRKEAFEGVFLKATLDDVLRDISQKSGPDVRVVATGADLQGDTISCAGLKSTLMETANAWLLIFGTGWGVTEAIIQRADFLLEPIKGVSPYNHLPVRAAVAVILDRLQERQ